MKILKTLFISILLVGCSKQEIKIPTVAEKGIQDTIYDNSKIWIFFKKTAHDTIAVLNKKNTISTTHWIFNIDKRLTLKKVIPLVQQMQLKREKNSPHKKEGMSNYFSFADTLSNKLSLIQFDKTIYKTDSLISKDEVKKNVEKYAKYNNINLTFSPNSITINDSNIDRDEGRSTIVDFIEFSSENKQTLLHLNFNQDLLYQDYIFYKTMISNLQSNSILINNMEFIFDKTKIPDCDCD